MKHMQNKNAERAECIHCHTGNSDFEFPVIEIQTLHIRDIGGERYVQGMGDEKRYGVCLSCAEHYLDEINHPTGKLVKKLLPFVLLIVVGIAVFFLFRDAEEAFTRLLGPIAALCGIVGIIVSSREIFSAKKEYVNLEEKDQISKAAWSLFLADAPKKNGDQDITYIPVNEKTRGMSVKDLSLQHDLLPAIAQKVSSRLKEESDIH